MKKTKKKLVLAKETVRELANLSEVRGGTNQTWTCPTRCVEPPLSENTNC